MTRRRSGFTLIELLVVMSIIMVLAGMLMVGISAARKAIMRARCETEIRTVMMMLRQYDTDCGGFPPSGIDEDSNGKISNSATGKMSHTQAWPKDWTDNEHPLVKYLTQNQELDGGLRTYEALYARGRTKSVSDDKGSYVYLVDPYGNPYRYLFDGRRPDNRKPSRVSGREPVLWSAGLDGLPDPDNNQEDDAPQNGKVDEKKELHDDLCSWF